ncbi:MAG TPA: AMP-binding protein, partial [Phycisphaerae bacterium]|nr:AMP-binding protein [Phycisphaerae bacterium]
HKVQVLVAVPTMFAHMASAKTASKEAFSSIIYAISGGEPLPQSLIEKFKNDLGHTLLEGFGLTETSPMVSFNTPWAYKAGSVGKPLPRVELRIVDDKDRPLGPNQDGELWVKGPNLMKGYWNKPQETAAAITSDGWFKTGDVARLDGEGFLFITGRKKELIIMAGEKVVPAEIEEVIRRHPAVLLAAVIGVKDPQRGEVPVAFVQLEPEVEKKPDANEIRAFVRQQLAPYKTPRDVYFLDAMPCSPTGKILKRELKVPQETTTTT